MRILLTTDVIHAGGAETFVLRLAQALHKKGHAIFLYVLYKNRIDYKVANAIAPDVPVYYASLRFIRLLQLADGLFLKLKIDYSIINTLLTKDLQKFLKRHNIQVLHSHLFTTDYVCTLATEQNALPIVSTMHGDYALYVRKLQQKWPIRIMNFYKKLNRILYTVKEFVCISDDQLAFFESEIQVPGKLSLKKIYNGYQASTVFTKRTKAELNIPVDAFIYGMVARGIPEKGWQLVIDAFISLSITTTYLVLVGDSDYVQSLKQQYSQHTRIIFVGYSPNPIEYIRLFDVGLFASTYYAESLPTVLIEYMFCKVPVIACSIAECGNMLDIDNNDAGLLVGLLNKQVPLQPYANAMQKLYNNKTLYAQLQRNTVTAFKKFDMNLCISQYETLYEKHLR